MNPYSTGSGKELHVRRSTWVLALMGAHSPWVIQLLVPLELQQLEQDNLDHTQERQASLDTTRYTTQTTRHSAKSYKSIKRSDKNSERSRGNEREGIVIQKVLLHTHTCAHARTHTHTHKNLEKPNAWQQIVISLDKFQPLGLKTMDMYWLKTGTTRYVQRHKQNLANIFDIWNQWQYTHCDLSYIWDIHNQY